MAADPGAVLDGPAALPELAGVAWRPRVSATSLRQRGRLWTLTTISHAAPFALAAVGLTVLVPMMFPLGAILLGHAWAIPELYANRGATVVKARPSAGSPAEHRALGLLGDLVDHQARELFKRTGLVIERGRLGVWLVGQAGALLIAPGGRRVYCMCVRTTDPELPGADRVAHLLLALRTDERGFATVANLAFSGAPWRLRRRLKPTAREALSAAVRAARTPVAVGS
jgi:hypothetical protein